MSGYGRAGTQNHRLSEALILSTGTPIPAHRTCRRRCRDAYNACQVEPVLPYVALLSSLLILEEELRVTYLFW